MNYWDSVGRWINTLLLFIVGVISFDTLFRLLEAQESNVIVGIVRLLSGVALVPFQGMFTEQEYVKTAAMAVLGYAMLVGISLAVLRSLQATRPARRPVYEYEASQRRPVRVPRPPDTRQQAAAERTTAQRTAATRSEPQPTRSATRKQATRKPVVRRTPATTPRPKQPEATRNGRPSAGQSEGAASRGSETAAPRGSETAGSRNADTAPKSDGAGSRGADATSKAGERSRLATTEVKASSDGSATPAPRARAPGKASMREANAADRDRAADE
jgi:hypothetical protein